MNKETKIWRKKERKRERKDAEKNKTK
jgi:hypothetical protein